MYFKTIHHKFPALDGLMVRYNGWSGDTIGWGLLRDSKSGCKIMEYILPCTAPVFLHYFPRGLVKKSIMQ